MRARSNPTLIARLLCLCRRLADARTTEAAPREFADSAARWVVACSGRDPATGARFDVRVVLCANGDATIVTRGAGRVALPESAAQALWALLLHFPHGFADMTARGARRRLRCRLEVHRRLPHHEVVRARCDLAEFDPSARSPLATARLASLLLRLAAPVN
ncbi:MAG: hypothetical protein ABMA13_02355 [Chthoniobacteraceae bacterium]